MKKYFSLLLPALLLVACNQAPSEKLISSYDVETVGSGFKTFAPAADVKVAAVQTPAGKWTVCATVPLRKVTDEKVDVLSSSLDLLNAAGSRLNDGFDLLGQDVMSLLPVLNDEEKPARNVIYSSSSELDKKTAAGIVAGASSVRLRLDAVIAQEEEVKKEEPKKEKAVFPDDPSVQDLVSYYGIRGILRSYESAYSSGNNAKCKQIKDRLSKIEDQVSDHPKGGRKISNALEDWIDDRIDEIEDKIDDQKDSRKKRR
jgi:hypothetical protein